MIKVTAHIVYAGEIPSFSNLITETTVSSTPLPNKSNESLKVFDKALLIGK